MRKSEKDFVGTGPYDVSTVKIIIFALRLDTLNKIYKACEDFRFSNMYFTELFYDLINFQLKYFSDSCRENAFFYNEISTEVFWRI